MRTLLIGTFLLLVCIASLILAPIAYILKKINIKKSRSFSYKLVRFYCTGILKLAGTKIKVNGAENIPDGPVLFIGNHSSYLDIPLGFYKIKEKELVFISKIEMKKVPLISTWLSLIGSLYLDRDNIKEGLKTILQGIEELKNGYSVFVFPEGTRSKDGKLLPFKEGTMKLAEKSGAPIVPVVITNSSTIFEKQAPWVKKAHVTMTFAKPIYTKDLTGDDKKFTARYVQTIMEGILEEQK